MDTGVLVIGAGASGLMAARELGRAGRRVVILEARERIGGRIYPLSEQEFGYPAQGGAEFLHGQAPLTKELLQEAGATLDHPTGWWSVADGKLRAGGALAPHDPILKSKLKELEKDMTVAEFFDAHFPGQEHAGLRDLIFRRVEGYDAADPSRFSVFALRDEIFGEDGVNQMNINEGYGVLLRFLEKECARGAVEIKLGREVKEIDFEGSGIRATCADGSSFEAARAIVSVPVSIIDNISFMPAIPEKLEAARKIGFGPVVKILLRFKERWWAAPERQSKFERLFFMFSNEEIPTWWTQYPKLHATLTGWAAGSRAEALAKLSQEETIGRALVSLSNIFKIGLEELRGELLVAKAVNWAADPHTRGAYSYATPDSKAAVEELSKPVAGKLFFAGEALYQGEVGGTVEAALSSGKAAAEMILSQN